MTLISTQKSAAFATICKILLTLQKEVIEYHFGDFFVFCEEGCKIPTIHPAIEHFNADDYKAKPGMLCNAFKQSWKESGYAVNATVVPLPSVGTDCSIELFGYHIPTIIWERLNPEDYPEISEKLDFDRCVVAFECFENCTPGTYYNPFPKLKEEYNAALAALFPEVVEELNANATSDSNWWIEDGGEPSGLAG